MIVSIALIDIIAHEALIGDDLFHSLDATFRKLTHKIIIVLTITTEIYTINSITDYTTSSHIGGFDKRNFELDSNFPLSLHMKAGKEL